MNRTVWAVAITVGIAGTSWAGPPGGGHGGGHGGHPGHAGGGHPGYGGGGGGYHGGGRVGVIIGFGGFGYGGGYGGFGFSNYGRGVGVSLSVPLFNTAPAYYNPPSYYARPSYPPVQYTPSAIIIRTPAAAPGGSFYVPEFTDPVPQISRPKEEFARPRAVPPPSAIPPAVPGTFRYDGDPANPVPVPTPDVRPPAPAPMTGGNGLRVSFTGGAAKAGYGFPVYGRK